MKNAFKYLTIGVLLIQKIASESSSSPEPVDENSTELVESPTTPCISSYGYGPCQGEYQEWGSFYGVFVVGVGICFSFFLCAGCLTFIIYFTCKRNTRTAPGVIHTTALPPPLEHSRPPPDFDEALKCSKVEYKLDIDDIPPPVYSSLKF